MKWNRHEGLLSSYFDCFETGNDQSEAFGNWELDLIGRRAKCLKLPPVTQKKTLEEEQLPKNSHLRKLLDSVAPDRHTHKDRLKLLSQVSDATRPTTADHELLSRLRAAEGRPNVLNFNHTLLNEYVFEIRRNQKTLKKSTSELTVKTIPSAVNVNLLSKGKFGVKHSLAPLKTVEWDSSKRIKCDKHDNGCKQWPGSKFKRVRHARDAFVSSSKNASLQCVLLKQIQPHIFRVNQNQRAQQCSWVTFIKLVLLPIKTKEELLEDRLKRIFRSKTESLIIKVQRKWRSNHRKKCEERLQEADLLKKHFWRIFISLRCRSRVRMAKTIRGFCKDYAKTANRFSLVIKKTRYRIIRCQRYIRGFLRCRRVRLTVLRKQWEKRLSRMMVPVKKSIVLYHNRLLALSKFQSELKVQLEKKLKQEMEDERRLREASIVQHLDTTLYDKLGLKPSLKEVGKRKLWENRKQEQQLMTKYNNRINRMKTMINGFSALERSNKSKSTGDIQKALDVLSGRKFARFKRLTAEEKAARTEELHQTSIEKIHRDFQLYKVPTRIISAYMNWIFHKYRRWHVHVSKHNIQNTEAFSLDDIQHLFFADDDDKDERSPSGDQESFVARKERELIERRKWPMVRLYTTLDRHCIAGLAVNLGVVCLVSDMQIMAEMTALELENLFEDTLITLKGHQRSVASTVDFAEAHSSEPEILRKLQIKETDATFPAILAEFDVLKQRFTPKPGKLSPISASQIQTPAETNPQSGGISRLGFSRPSTNASTTKTVKRSSSGELNPT
jgi:hypothetical protein